MDEAIIQTNGERTRKFMTIHVDLHLRDDIDRFYMSRKEEGRGLFSCIDETIRGQEWYTKIAKTNYSRKYLQWRDHTVNNRKQENRNGGKQLYGCFRRQTDDIAKKIPVHWQKRKKLKRKLYLLIATRNNAKITIHIIVKINDTRQSWKGRFYVKWDETVNLIISESKKKKMISTKEIQN